jgi:replicative DNA helicase
MIVSQNLLAEQSVLETLCKFGNDAVLEVSDILSKDSFSDSKNKVIYEIVLDAINKYPKLDYRSVVNTAKELGYKDWFDNDGNNQYLRNLFDANPNLSNVRIEAKRVAKTCIARELQRELNIAGKELSMVTGAESVDQILGLAQKRILDYTFKMEAGNEEAPVLIGDNIDSYIEYLENNQDRTIGISTGFNRFDEYIGGGLRRKSVSLIGARAKVGKSQIADNIAIHVAHHSRIPVLMLDTEMNSEDHQNRILAHFAKIDTKKIERGQFAKNPNEKDRILKASNKIKGMPYHYKNISGKPFEEIVSIMRRWIMKEVGFDENGRTKDCLIIYDYLKLMSSESITQNIAEFQAMGFLITQLHNFCVTYDCPVLSFVQLNRDGINVEDTSAISQSDRLVWLCTNFSIFKPKTQEEIAEDGDEYGNRKLIPLVARHGPGIEDGNYINMIMQGQYAQIVETKTKFEIKKDGPTNDSDDGDPAVPF